MNFAETKYLKINFDEILERLREYAASKAEAHEVRTILLAGSLAKGTYTGTSDADIIVIADGVPKRALDRFTLFADPTLPIDIQLRVYTTDEFTEMLGHGDWFALESIRVGIPLCGKQFFEILKKSKC